ncbi:tyrosine--tRNA ligase [Candidatus Pacearchaeota archaeon]|nr:tyrosine--tRNA ligase [Candidatus Pacearchaeota archaeon]|tara:strand:- start:5341 stop:6279 length:939 start_codon:yes stop_codon:yes gene_type:complete
MNQKQKIELIKRNTEEIINPEKLLSTKNQPVVYCGYEPSGDIHIGHFVTILKLKDFEDAGFKVKILLADWHAWLNKKGDQKFISEQAKKWQKAFKKIGLKNPEIIIGTSFQKKPEYFDDVLELAANSTINRGVRAMQGVARDIEHAKVTQIIYPFMQVADMKALNVDAVVAGMEQRKIHMIALESLKEINYPVPAFVHTPIIPSLKGKGKMSSSDKSGLISIKDSSNEINKKISKAYCPEAQPNPVLDITKIIIFPVYQKLNISRPEKFGGNVKYDSYEKLEKDFLSKKLHPADLKKVVSEKLAKVFEKIRQ